MSILLLTAILFSALILLLTFGLPLVFSLGGIACIGLYFIMGSKSVQIIYLNTISQARDTNYITIPLFTYMAFMLERSGAVEILFETIQSWAGSIAGSLAMGAIAISTILASMVGLSSATIITMGVTVLPSMLRCGYDKNLAMGSIAAGSTLGIMIPPSVIGLLLAGYLGITPGRMFIAGFVPGFLIATIIISYIGIRCFFNPSLGPPVSTKEEVSVRTKLRSLSGLIMPALLVIMVLGSIFKGIATTLESAAVGALGSLIIVAINRRLNWKVFAEVNYNTLKLSAMVMWILFAANSFRAVYVASGAIHLVQNILVNLPFGTIGTIVAMQLILLFLGCFLDELAILIIAVPVFAPVIRALNIEPIWFGVLFIINMQIAELSPPIGINIFYMKAIVPKETTFEELYRSVLPFIGCLVISMIIIMFFPRIATWLPYAVIPK